MSGRLTSGQLKIIAMGTMFLDHAAAAVIFNNGLNRMSPLLENIGIAMRLVGRMAFPLYAFLLVQGFMWTRDWKKYMSRMVVFALVSEIPFNLMLTGDVWYPRAQNTIVTLAVGLVCLKMLEVLEKQFDFAPGSISLRKRSSGTEEIGNIGEPGERETPGRKLLGYSLGIWVIVASMFAVEALCGDYGMQGLLLIVVLYMFRHRPAEQVIAGCLALVLIYRFGINVLFAWIAFFFISRYNGERGRELGYFPYVFYPAHLLAVYLAGIFVTAR